METSQGNGMEKLSPLMVAGSSLSEELSPGKLISIPYQSKANSKVTMWKAMVVEEATPISPHVHPSPNIWLASLYVVIKLTS